MAHSDVIEVKITAREGVYRGKLLRAEMRLRGQTLYPSSVQQVFLFVPGSGREGTGRVDLDHGSMLFFRIGELEGYLEIKVEGVAEPIRLAWEEVRDLVRLHPPTD
jgi:hypothetical protein